MQQHVFVFLEFQLKLNPSTPESAVKISSINNDKKPIILRKKILPIQPEISLEDENKSETAIALPVVSKDGNLYTCLLCEGDETGALIFFFFLLPINFFF